ncbi:MAG: winged helix-turn-helix transcriptional regulator [Promethearchaeota archaeon]
MNNSENIKNITEKLILKELHKNPRISLTAIAKKIGKSRQTVSKIFNKMVNNKKIEIVLRVNKNIYNITFFNIKIKVKSCFDMQNFITLFSNCPRVLTILESINLNTLQVLMYFDKLNNKSGYFIPCPLLIKKERLDAKVLEVNIDPFCKVISPRFININFKDKELMKCKSPCGIICSNCENYDNSCPGCPSSLNYKGSMFF